jgi:integrase
MGVYRRGRWLWICYAGPTGDVIRESTRQSDQRTAERILRDRKSAVAADAWRPVAELDRPTVAEYAPRWLAKLEARKVLTVHDYHARTRDHVLPLVGSMRLCDMRPRHVHAFVAQLAERGLAPRTQRHVYECLHSLCKAAVIDEVIAASPCVLERGILPAISDRDPTWRYGALFAVDEIERLISADEVPEDRRVLYALQALAGLRFGEAAGRRWRDLDGGARPLGRLIVATQYNDRPLKTKVPREVPVHPTLAAILAEWRLGGWTEMMGRMPTRDDFVIPSRRGAVRSVRLGHTRLDEDLARLGLRARRQHDLRRSFITLARSRGARTDVLKAITHGAGKAVMDLYTTWPWATLCEAVAMLEVRRSGAHAGVQRIASASDLAVSKAWNERGGRDLNPRRKP